MSFEPCAVVQSICSRKLFVTTEGDMGLAPYDVREGDHICLFPGAATPFVLRSDIEHQEQSDTHARASTLIGECYCHTLMENVNVRTLGGLHRFEIR